MHATVYRTTAPKTAGNRCRPARSVPPTSRGAVPPPRSRTTSEVAAITSGRITKTLNAALTPCDTSDGSASAPSASARPQIPSTTRVTGATSTSASVKRMSAWRTKTCSDAWRSSPYVRGRERSSRAGRPPATRRSGAEDPRREMAGVARVVEPDAGDRDAGRHLHDRQHRVEASERAEAARQRDPDDRQVGVRGGDAGQRGGQPGAGDDHPQAAHPRVLAVLGDGVGVAMRRHDADLGADAPLLEDLGRLLHLLHVGLRAHDDPDARRVDVELVELRLRVGLRQWRGRGGRLGLLAPPMRSPAPGAMSRRSCRPSKVIKSAAAYAASRAAAGPSPRPVTLSTRPPAVAIAPSAVRAVRACVTSTPVRAAASRPAMRSPLDAPAG